MSQDLVETAVPAIAARDGAHPPQLTSSAIFLRFLRFGMLAWGGPVAQIAMIRRELVDEEQWLPSGRFNRLLAVYQVLPGPEAHELCVHFGMLAGRRLGGLLAGLGFMLPGFLLMFALSWLYFHLDISQSALGPIFLGVQAAVIALIVRAVHRIGGHILVDRWLWGVGIGAAIATLFGTSFWLVLPLTGLLYLALVRSRFAVAGVLLAGGILLAFASGGGAGWTLSGGNDIAPLNGVAVTLRGGSGLLELFLSGLKAGLLTFGGAYTVIPFLRSDAVGRGWMTDAQFLDGLALSGILPAPLIIFSTFVGYAAGGALGALAMTIGIFLPAFAFSLLFHEQLERVVENQTLHTFLEGVSAGVVGLIAVTTLELALSVAGRLPSLALGVGIFAVSLALLYLWKAKTNVVGIIFMSGLAGWLAFAR